MTPAGRGIRPTLGSQNPTHIHSAFFLPLLTYSFWLKSNDGFFSECVYVIPIHMWPESSDCLSTNFSSWKFKSSVDERGQKVPPIPLKNLPKKLLHTEIFETVKLFPFSN